MLKKALKNILAKRSINDLPLVKLDEILNAKEPSTNKRTIFSFGTGRAGMRWMTRVFTIHDNCTGGCERFRVPETFYRYVTWNKLPIDNEGFYRLIQQAIYYDWELSGDISYNASPYFSHGADEILKRYKPDYAIINLREPEKIVRSLVKKRWFSFSPDYRESDKVLGMQIKQSKDDFYRNFGRVIPSGEQYEKWLSLSPIGRVAWYCSEVAGSIRSALDQNNDVKPFYIKLEEADQNYAYYLKLREYFKLENKMSIDQFMKLKGKMRNKGAKVGKPIQWSRNERKEFEDNINNYGLFYHSSPNFL